MGSSESGGPISSPWRRLGRGKDSCLARKVMADAGQSNMLWLQIHCSCLLLWTFLNCPLLLSSRSSQVVKFFIMAPDISQLAANGSSGHTDHYEIPNITFRDPKNRRLKVLTIGAGVSGILKACQIQKQCQK
jgi:hypothetical protein